MLNDFCKDLLEKSIAPKKTMVKKGTLEIDMVETTPLVWKGRLMRCEWVRKDAYLNKEGRNYLRFIDWETEETTPGFGYDHCFVSAHVEGDTAYAFAVNDSKEVGRTQLDVFWSKDLIHWESKVALQTNNGVTMFNNTVCKGPDGYYMAIEIGGPREIVGVGFTIVYAKSQDLINWEFMEWGSHIYTRERYSACPVLRYNQTDGKFYMIYLEGLPCHRWQPYIVRTSDFVNYELGLKNPIMFSDDDDKLIVRPEKFTPEQIEFIRNTPDCNNSDLDMCEFNGKTIIVYSWGIQLGKEFLAYAEYDGPMDEFLMSFFAD